MVMNRSMGVNTTEPDGVCTKFSTILVRDDDHADNFLYSRFDDVIYMILHPIVVALGIPGNAAFLFMVYRLAHMRTPVNFFLVNLAITDIIYLSAQSALLWLMFFSTPLSYRFPFDTSLSCIIIYFIGYISHYCSISMITLISIERFYAICHPLKHRRMQSKKHIRRAITVAYIVSTVLTLFTLLKRMEIFKFCFDWLDTERYKNMVKVFRVCGPLLSNPGIVVSTELIYIALFFIAAIINSVLYARIIVVLGSRSALAVNGAAEQQGVSIRNQVARALVINGILFFLTQIPMRLNDINDILQALDIPLIPPSTQKTNFFSFALLLLSVNSALNPYVYAFSSSNYRQGFKDAFTSSVKYFSQSNRSSSAVPANNGVPSNI